MSGSEVALTRVVVGAFLWAGFATVFAQAPATVLDGVYTPAQAMRGEALYTRSCSGCHEGQDADGPLLIGKLFLDRWREDSLGSLFSFVSTSMPGNAPGSLDAQVSADVVAFLLEANGLPSGSRELTPETAARVQLVGPDGPKPLTNLTIVRAVGCLTRAAGNAWVLDKAGGPRPVRSRIVKGTTPEELAASASQALGSQSFPLMSVTSQSEPLAGHKVQVKGVLTRQGSLERINVMSLESVAPACGG